LCALQLRPAKTKLPIAANVERTEIVLRAVWNISRMLEDAVCFNAHVHTALPSWSLSYARKLNRVFCIML